MIGIIFVLHGRKNKVSQLQIFQGLKQQRNTLRSLMK